MPIGEPVLFGGGVDRPIEPAPKQHLAHRQQQHLHETAIAGDALDLLHRQRRIVRRHQDRRAQARLPVQQFLRHPVVDRRAQRRRHVLVEQRDRAVQHVADGEARAERIERLAADRVEVAGREGPTPAASPGRAVSGEFGG